MSAISEEGFKAYLRPYIDRKEPFSAYWHPMGFGLLKTGAIPVFHNEYVLHVPGKADKTYKDYSKCWNAKERTRGAWMETIKVEGKPKTLSAGAFNRWKTNIEKLRRSCYGPVYTVDFDGVAIMTEGGIEL